VLSLLLPVLWRNRARRHSEEDGRRLKGPEMVTVKEFNKKTGADGISFLTGRGRESLSIPRSLESSHMMMMGDTGAGKKRFTASGANADRRARETRSCMIPRSNTHHNFSILPAVILS